MLPPIIAARGPAPAAGAKSMSPSTTVSLQTVGLLIGSNLFMTFAWYGHLKTLGD